MKPKKDDPITTYAVALQCGTYTNKLKLLVRIGLLPEPDLPEGCYTVRRAQATVRAYQAKIKPLRNLTDLSRIHKKSPSEISQDIAAGRIPCPDIRIGHRDYWGAGSIEKMRLFYRKKPPRGTATDRYNQVQAAGFYSISSLSKACGVNDIVIQNHIKNGRIAKPTHRYYDFPYRLYDQKEADEIKIFLATYKRPQGPGSRKRRKK
jgi:hypothetical protein